MARPCVVEKQVHAPPPIAISPWIRSRSTSSRGASLFGENREIAPRPAGTVAIGGDTHFGCAGSSDGTIEQARSAGVRRRRLHGWSLSVRYAASPARRVAHPPRLVELIGSRRSDPTRQRLVSPDTETAIRCGSLDGSAVRIPIRGRAGSSRSARYSPRLAAWRTDCHSETQRESASSASAPSSIRCLDELLSYFPDPSPRAVIDANDGVCRHELRPGWCALCR